MSKIYVFGHKIPDTDSILAAIIFSKFLKAKGEEAIPCRIGEVNNETKFLLDKLNWKVPQKIDSLPEGTAIALVDHNEPKQSIDNVNLLDIQYVLDHHPFGNFSSNKALYIWSEPLACCGSILYKLFKRENIEITKDIAEAMLAIIISDTLFFRSPTTTDEDKKILEELNKIIQIDNLDVYSMDMFNAKSDLGDISVEELIKIDYKDFESGGNKFSIGVVETTNPNYSLNRKEEIVKKIKEIKEKSGLNFIMLSIVDIINEKNITIIGDDQDALILKEVFGISVENNLADLGTRISRKKQLLPQLTEYFNKKLI